MLLMLSIQALVPTTVHDTYYYIRVSVDTLYRDGANDVSRERIQTAPLAHPGRAS